MTDGATTLRCLYGNRFVITGRGQKKVTPTHEGEDKHAHIWEKKDCFRSHLALLWSRCVNFSETHNMLSQICSVLTKTSYFRLHNWHVKSLPKQRWIYNNVPLFCFCHIFVWWLDKSSSPYSKVIIHKKNVASLQSFVSDFHFTGRSHHLSTTLKTFKT